MNTRILQQLSQRDLASGMSGIALIVKQGSDAKAAAALPQCGIGAYAHQHDLNLDKQTRLGIKYLAPFDICLLLLDFHAAIPIAKTAHACWARFLLLRPHSDRAPASKNRVFVPLLHSSERDPLVLPRTGHTKHHLYLCVQP